MKGTAPLSPKDRIVFPLDLSSLSEALRFVALLKDQVGVFKIGLELFVNEGPSSVIAVKEKAPRSSIFLDLKLHDIPETVKGAMRSAVGLGVDFITVHTNDGGDLLKAAVDEGGGKTKVLGVTVLTSLSLEALKEAGIDPLYKRAEDLVLHRARLARASGCAGVVCSGLEARAVREEFGEDFLIVTPGVRGKGDAAGDQSRVVTPYDAIINGADYIVVGRPIRTAPDPAAASVRIAEEIERALRDRG